MDGIINIYKPKGITSFDVIRKLRKILKIKRIGHTGTLDPLATGILVVCIGRATRLVSDIEAQDKIYKAEMLLGSSTDTYDSEGKIINESDKPVPENYEIENVIKTFIGVSEQVPPMYSAIKINGKKLYELARENIVVERKSRKIDIEYINNIEIKDNIVIFETKVSKGTYIRSLVNDIGEKLGTYAHMTSLERLAVGEYNTDTSYTLEDIESMTENNDYSYIKTVEETFKYLEINLDSEKEYNLFINGNSQYIENLDLKGDKLFRVYYNNNFIGLGIFEEKNRIKGYKYF